jgi:hypothetical protein
VKADMATKIKLEEGGTMAIKSIGWNNPQTNSDQQNQPFFTKCPKKSMMAF